MEFLEKLNVYLGKWLGIPVTLHWSWVLMLAVMALLNPKIAMVYAAAFFIVLLHEFGHCIAGQYYSMEIRSITLYPFGGVANMKLPKVPFQEIVVALAGPAVNVVLIPVLLLFAPLAPDFFSQVGGVNLVLLVFNLLPAFPMDGGRVFRGLLAMLLKDHVKATVIAGRVGQGFCLAFAILGVLSGVPGLVLVGVFIFVAAEAEIQMAKESRTIKQIHESLTGIKTPPTSNSDVQDSARMLVDIQQRLADLERKATD